MNRRIVTAALFGVVLGATAVGASSCSETPAEGTHCETADGSGTWLTDESDSLKSGYTVVVSICVDDGGNVVGLDVE